MQKSEIRSLVVLELINHLPTDEDVTIATLFEAAINVGVNMYEFQSGKDFVKQEEERMSSNLTRDAEKVWASQSPIEMWWTLTIFVKPEAIGPLGVGFIDLEGNARTSPHNAIAFSTLKMPDLLKVIVANLGIIDHLKIEKV